MAGGVALFILAGLAGAMLVMGKLMHKPELVTAYPVFLLLLVAALIRTHAETLYYGLFVQRQHRAIWLGNLLFLATSLLLNLIFIPWLGLMGLGAAAIVSAIMLAVWRWATLKSGKGAATGERLPRGPMAWFAAAGGEDPAAG